MTCDDFRRLISAYRDDEMEADDRRKVIEHMRSCDSCRNFAEEIDGLGDVLRKLPPAPCPPDIEQAVIEKIQAFDQHASEKKSFWNGYYRIPRGVAWAAALALALLIIEVTVNPFEHKGDEQSPSIPSESTPYVQKVVFSEYDVVYSTPVTDMHTNN